MFVNRTRNKSYILSIFISVTFESIIIQFISTEIHFTDLDMHGLWIAAADAQKYTFFYSDQTLNNQKEIDKDTMGRNCISFQ